MAIQMKIKVGRNEIQVSGKDEKEVIEQASFFGQLPSKCGHCDSDEIGFCHSCAQDKYDYYFLKCKSCAYEFKFGIRKSDHRLFPKTSDGWVPPYQGSNSGRDEDEDQSQPRQRQEPQQQRSSRPPTSGKRETEPEPEDEDNVPF